jgi:hypothetical protein
MTHRSYDHDGAERLIPLLRVLGREIRERGEAIHAAERAMRALRRDASLSSRERRIREGFFHAEISNHKREIRQVNRELARLGCLVDDADPSMVHIPGLDGDHAQGFVWRAGEAEIHEV